MSPAVGLPNGVPRGIASAPCSRMSHVASGLFKHAALVSLFLMSSPGATQVLSIAAGSPVALAPTSVWARGFLQPRGVAVDAHDNVYVSDRGTGTVTRIASDQSTTIVLRGLDRPIGVA